MSNKRNSKKVGHFFKHYAGLLVLAVICAVVTVVLISYI